MRVSKVGIIERSFDDYFYQKQQKDCNAIDSIGIKLSDDEKMIAIRTLRLYNDKREVIIAHLNDFKGDL